MKEWTFEANIDRISWLTDQVNEELEKLNCPMKVQMQIDVAIDELLARTVSLTFIDSGVPYDPLAKPDPDVTLSVEEREVGGLGIFLVKKTMDDMTYVRRDGRNELTIRKRI